MKTQQETLAGTQRWTQTGITNWLREDTHTAILKWQHQGHTINIPNTNTPEVTG